MNYISRRVPRAKQAEAAPLVRGRDFFAVLMEMRTGKTKVIVDDWGEAALAGDCLDLLVVAPGGAYRPWPAAIADDLPVELAARTKMLLWDSGRAKTKVSQREREAFMGYRDGPRALVVNVEALSVVKGAQDLCVEFLRQRPGKNECVIDESVRVKEVDSRCGRFCVDVLAPLAARRRIMTGLVSPRSPLDLYNQFKFLDWKILGHQDYATFKARYARVRQVCMLPSARLYGMLKSRLGLGGYLTRSELRVRVALLAPDLDPNKMTDAELRSFLMIASESVDRDAAVTAIKALGGYVQTVSVIEGYENVEELREKIAPHSFRCRLEDCYDLPASSYAWWDVAMHPEQRRVYDELRENATAELQSLDHVTATHVIVRMLRLHQVLCGHVVDDERREVQAVPELRTAALVDLLSDYDGQAVVWCSYDYSIRVVTAALERAFGDGSVARFWGGNVGTREREEEEFKRGLRRFVVATPDAGKYGRDWSCADLCVYYSCRNDLDQRQQSEERLKAVGKARAVAYVDLRVPGTVDEKIVRCLRDKIDMAGVISGDDWREWLV